MTASYETQISTMTYNVERGWRNGDLNFHYYIKFFTGLVENGEYGL